MSTLRRELTTGGKITASVDGLTAYLLILRAVEEKRGLIHGQLHDHGESCAIGSYFDLHPQSALPQPLIDEVATVNDAAPRLTPAARKRHVLQWLRWKLGTLGWTVPVKRPVATARVMDTLARQVDDLEATKEATDGAPH